MRSCELIGNVVHTDESVNAPGGGGMSLRSSSASLEHCVVLDNDAITGGGLYLYDDVALVLTSSILAYNRRGNLMSEQSDFDGSGILWNDLYSPEGMENHNLSGLDPSNLTVEPGFLVYNAEGLPLDLHLSQGSPLVDGGDPEAVDLDGSRQDLGMYGGVGGAVGPGPRWLD